MASQKKKSKRAARRRSRNAPAATRRKLKRKATKPKPKPKPKKRRAPKPKPRAKSKPKRKAKRRAKRVEVVPERVELGSSVQVMPDLDEGPAHHPELRFFRSGNALLGYVEGRPGVIGVNLVLPARHGEPLAELSKEERERRAEAREEAAERFKESPPGQDASDGGGAALASWLDDMLTAWDFCEDGGAFVEAEVTTSGGEGE